MNKCVALMAAYERQDWTEAGRLIDVYKKSPGHNENLEEVEKKVEAEKDEADWSAAALPLDEKQVDNAKKLRPDGLGNVWMNRTIDLIVAYERGDWVEAERLIQLYKRSAVCNNTFMQHMGMLHSCGYDPYRRYA
ncbi:unnamed protein product [Durusdinium trenchii]